MPDQSSSSTGVDPFSLAAGATQFGLGALQSLIGGHKAKKAERALENLQTPTYTANKSINDYYQNALQRYNVNPYQSAQYQNSLNSIGRNTAAGIGALQDRRSAVGGIGRLVALGNDAAIKSGISAENEQNQRFGQLGSATNMKAGDDRTAFQYNKIAPYEKQYNLLAMKAGAGATQQNAGITNAFNGLGNLAMLGSDYYSNKSNSSSTNSFGGGSGIPASYSDYLRMKRG